MKVHKHLKEKLEAVRAHYGPGTKEVTVGKFSSNDCVKLDGAIVFFGDLVETGLFLDGMDIALSGVTVTVHPLKLRVTQMLNGRPFQPVTFDTKLRFLAFLDGYCVANTGSDYRGTPANRKGLSDGTAI